jgi:hypothetical protein
MAEVSVEKNAVLSRISEIVESLIQGKSIFQELDKSEMIQLLSTLLLKNWSSEQVMAIPDDQITSIIKDVMVIEVMSGLLNDFTPEEMEAFEAAVAGR